MSSMLVILVNTKRSTVSADEYMRCAREQCEEEGYQVEIVASLEEARALVESREGLEAVVYIFFSLRDLGDIAQLVITMGQVRRPRQLQQRVILLTNSRNFVVMDKLASIEDGAIAALLL